MTLLAHDFFAVTPEVLEAFTAETGITVEVILGGDAGIVVNQALLTAGNPVADVLFGVDTTLLSRALDGDVFIPYVSPALGLVPEEFVVDSRVTPVDFGDVCLNYDRAAFVDTAPPTTLRDLADPRFAGMLVVEGSLDLIAGARLPARHHRRVRRGGRLHLEGLLDRPPPQRRPRRLRLGHRLLRALLGCQRR